MPHESLAHGTLAPNWLYRAERLACAVAALWLQVVGVVTGTVLHHILHALPLFVLLLPPRNRAVRLTATLTGFAWIFMLAVVTPMLYDALIHRYLFSRADLPYTWLASIMALVSCVWLGLNLTILSHRPSHFLWFTLGGMALTVSLASMHPFVSAVFAIPLEQTLRGQYAWGLVLLGEIPLVLFIPWWSAVRLTGSTGLRITPRGVFWQVAYWSFFLLCMIAGLRQET